MTIEAVPKTSTPEPAPAVTSRSRLRRTVAFDEKTIEPVENIEPVEKKVEFVEKKHTPPVEKKKVEFVDKKSVLPVEKKVESTLPTEQKTSPRTPEKEPIIIIRKKKDSPKTRKGKLSEAAKKRWMARKEKLAQLQADISVASEEIDE